MIQTIKYLKNSIKQKLKMTGPCGDGSSLINTEEIREFIPKIIKEKNIKSMIDVGCGDWSWMKLIKEIKDIEYTGYDKDRDFIESNKKFGHAFHYIDVAKDVVYWPKVDLILCRDLLIHLSDELIIKLLNSFKNSGSKYLMTTTYPKAINRDFSNTEKLQKYTRHCRPSRNINLLGEPYNLIKPIEFIKEKEGKECAGRLVGLWELK